MLLLLLLLLIAQTYISSLLEIGPGTAEILMTLSLWWVAVGGGGGGVKSFSCQTQLLS